MVFSSKSQIRKAGKEFSKHSHDPEAQKIVQEYREFRLRCLKTTLGIINKATLPNKCLLSVRLKRLISIKRKLSREGTYFDLSDLDDIIGVRIICRSHSEARELTACLNTLAEQHEVKDYIKTPNKKTGYRAAHHIFRFEQLLSTNKPIKVRFEIQVRSYLQHRWAIWSESKGDATKLGNTDRRTLAKLHNLSEQIAAFENKEPDYIQDELLEYSSVDSASYSVAWRSEPLQFSPELSDRMPPQIKIFQDLDIAVTQLNYLENHSSETARDTVLLLVGISGCNENEIEQILFKTHPVFTLGFVSDPTDILRKISNKASIS